jgi:hypothetical protein
MTGIPLLTLHPPADDRVVAGHHAGLRRQREQGSALGLEAGGQPIGLTNAES